MVCFIGSLLIGAVNIAPTQAISALLNLPNAQASPYQAIIYEIRLPRALLALLVGAILSLTGLATQSLFKNPLAEPSVIGVSSGSALGCALALVLLPQWTSASNLMASSGLSHDLLVSVCAFGGGLLTTWVVYRFAQNALGTSTLIMLLVGIAITTLAGSVISLLSYFSTDETLRQLSTWAMGSLAYASWSAIGLCSLIALGLCVFFWGHAQFLNALLLGERDAKHLGVPVESLKKHLILLIAIGVAICVSFTGLIGFIGLIIPNLGRFLCGANHYRLVPVCTLLGALLLCVADIVSRSLLTVELPVGIITALIGAPFFLFILFNQKIKRL